MTGTHAVRFLRIAAVLALFLLANAALSPAQLATGTILGVVRDASGAVVPGASVSIQNVDTRQTRTVTSGSDGAYRAPALPVGHYTVKIEKNGFKPETQQGLVLDVAQEMVINTSLQVGTAVEEVVVTGEAPLVNTTSSALGTLVNEQRMSDLPLNGRNYIDLTLLQPGVSQNKSMGNSHGTTGVWFSSNGAPTRSNVVTLDGALMMTSLGGAATSEAGTTLGVDGIREFKMVTTSFSAEYGQSMGSQMVMVSKSGANQWHGDGFEYLRNSSLDARNYFDTAASSGGKRLPEFQRNNFGGSFGGPIRRDKTFFYGVYEGLRQNLGFTARDNVPAANCHTANHIYDNTCDPNLSAGQTKTVRTVMQPLLDLFPAPNLPGNQYSFPSINRASVDTGRCAWTTIFPKRTRFSRATPWTTRC